MTLVLGWCFLEWEKGLGEEMVFFFWRISAFLLAKKSPGACLPASQPGSGQVLLALALLLPKELLNSILGCSIPHPCPWGWPRAQPAKSPCLT